MADTANLMERPRMANHEPRARGRAEHDRLAHEDEQDRLYQMALRAGAPDFPEPEPTSCPPGCDPTEWGRRALDNWLDAYWKYQDQVINAFLRVDTDYDLGADQGLAQREQKGAHSLREA